MKNEPPSYQEINGIRPSMQPMQPPMMRPFNSQPSGPQNQPPPQMQAMRMK